MKEKTDYKCSNYNFLCKSLNGDILLSNSLYDRKIKINKDYSEDLLFVLDTPNNVKGSIQDTIKEKLIENHFLVPSEFSEKSYVDYLCNGIVYSNDMLHLTIIPTNSCNFRCRYCYQFEDNNSLNEQSIQAIKNFIRKQAHKYNGIFISWYGGEPLLKLDIVLEIMQFAKIICRENRIPLYGQMTTNGYLLTEDVFSKLIENHILSYMVTIDGTRETHNYQRPHKTDCDSFGTITNNLIRIRDTIRSNNFRIGVRINISPSIYPVLPEFAKMISDLFSEDKRFGVIWEWVKDWGGERICNNYDLIVNDYESTGYDKYLSFFNQNMVQLDRGQTRKRIGNEMCIASRKNGFIINWNLKIYKCAMALYDEKLSDINCVGLIAEDGSLILDEYKNSVWVGQGNVPDSCGECVHYPECMGLLCPLATKIRKIFDCPHTLIKEEMLFALNDDAFGKYEQLF